MPLHDTFERYQELQRSVGWSDADAQRVRAAAGRLRPHLASLIDDFLATIQQHPDALKVSGGAGAEQLEQLRGMLRGWLEGLFSGRYDADFVARRWQVGRRHVELGLDQLYTHVAFARMRTGLVRLLHETRTEDAQDPSEAVESLNKLLDLDLAIIQEAYNAQHALRQQRVEHMATLGQVAGGVVHELRNPLNVIKTSVYYLIHARNSTAEKQAEHLTRIERQVALADSVISTLSSFAKVALPALKPSSVAQCVQKTLDAIRLPDTLQLCVDCPASLPAVLMDSDQIEIALSNLIRNAGDAMPSGGRLSITCRQVQDKVEIEVADTGTGIAGEHLHQVMEPLFSTKARGLGLGLAIAQSIIAKNQGQLRFTTQLGQGTTFTIQLQAVA